MYSSWVVAAESLLDGRAEAEELFEGLESGVGARSWTGWSRAASKLSWETPGEGLGGQKRRGVGGSLSGELGGESRADRKLEVGDRLVYV